MLGLVKSAVHGSTFYVVQPVSRTFVTRRRLCSLKRDYLSIKYNDVVKISCFDVVAGKVVARITMIKKTCLNTSLSLGRVNFLGF